MSGQDGLHRLHLFFIAGRVVAAHADVQQAQVRCNVLRVSRQCGLEHRHGSRDVFATHLQQLCLQVQGAGVLGVVDQQGFGLPGCRVNVAAAGCKARRHQPRCGVGGVGLQGGGNLRFSTLELTLLQQRVGHLHAQFGLQFRVRQADVAQAVHHVLGATAASQSASQRHRHVAFAGA